MLVAGSSKSSQAINGHDRWRRYLVTLDYLARKSLRREKPADWPLTHCSVCYTWTSFLIFRTSSSQTQDIGQLVLCTLFYFLNESSSLKLYDSRPQHFSLKMPCVLSFRNVRPLPSNEWSFAFSTKRNANELKLIRDLQHVPGKICTPRGRSSVGVRRFSA
jgi:hypothetical protein